MDPKFLAGVEEEKRALLARKEQQARYNEQLRLREIEIDHEVGQLYKRLSASLDQSKSLRVYRGPAPGHAADDMSNRLNNLSSNLLFMHHVKKGIFFTRSIRPLCIIYIAWPIGGKHEFCLNALSTIINIRRRREYISESVHFYKFESMDQVVTELGQRSFSYF